MEERLVLKSALLGHTIPAPVSQHLPLVSVQSPDAFVALAQSVRGLLLIDGTRRQDLKFDSGIPRVLLLGIYCLFFLTLTSFIGTLQ